MGKDFESGLARARSKEKTNQPQGRSGGGTMKLGMKGGNPTKGGGINRATKGKKG
jgi:hypothetical protein